MQQKGLPLPHIAKMGIEQEIQEKASLPWYHNTYHHKNAASSQPCPAQIVSFMECMDKQCQTELEAEHVECEVVGEGCQGGAKVDLKVVSLKFEGVPLLKRHQMVNELFSKVFERNLFFSFVN